MRQREGEALAARERLRSVEEVRDALTVEVQELGRRNNNLEQLAVEAPKLRKVTKCFIHSLARTDRIGGRPWLRELGLSFRVFDSLKQKVLILFFFHAMPTLKEKKMTF